MGNGDTGHSAIREALILETAEALRREQPRGGEHGLVLSRATWLHRSDLLAEATVLPVVGGQTIWDTRPQGSNQITVVEDPNYFGRRERDAPTGGNTRHISWWPSRDDPVGSSAAADGPFADLETARHLATGLRSIPGVRLPHGQPEAPWFIVSLPCSPPAVVTALQIAGFSGCRETGSTFPEFPGGIHLQVAWPRRDNGRVVATVRTVIEDLERQ